MLPIRPQPQALSRFAASLVLLASLPILAQDRLTGVVMEQNEKGTLTPMELANVHWRGTQTGTVTDKHGYFSLPLVDNTRTLIISYVGYRSDTIDVEQTDKLTVVLKKSYQLNEVEVVYERRGTEISYLETRKLETMGQKELFKAACCNLSESFETNPSVDVAMTNAVTGTRQIMMLGLDGKYSQISRESMPDVRGLNTAHGLGFIPGSWIESIQMNKGAGSVVNGYESITGQINVELKKPWDCEKWFVNGYFNQAARSELNFNGAVPVTDKVWTGVLLHANARPIEVDGNMDGFLDFPTGYQVNGINRWKIDNGTGWEADAGVRLLMEDRQGGQTESHHNGSGNQTPYRIGWKSELAEVWAKSGYVFPNKRYRSMGIQTSATALNQNSYFGSTDYRAQQRSGYVNAIYQDILGTTTHKYKAGLSLVYDGMDEHLNVWHFHRTEIVPGAFAEYAFNYFDKFSVVAGLRGDLHNYYGFFLTPRLHGRYEIREGSVLRFSGGRGQRTANVLAENSAYLASSRKWIIHGDSSVPGFGLLPEVAWNFGGNFTQDFKLDFRPGAASVDVYQTVFSNQTVVDLDYGPSEVHVYNLRGRSYATSIQAQVDYELRRRLETRVAWRWYEVRTNLGGELRDRPFVSRQRAFVNLAYATKKAWKMDITAQWQGPKRIPSTFENPVAYQRETRSPDLYLVNAQVSKTWKERYEVYVGVENLTNVMQPNPIVGSDDPFGNYFDSALIWGPVFGRMVYAGFRLSSKALKG